MNTRVWILALLWPLATLGATAPLLEIADPAGDDVGDGRLVYPRSDAFEPGDLDLRALRVHADGDGLRFEATFANPVRHPAAVPGGGMGNESLSVFARRGFYAFNLDVYVGSAARRGSGHSVSLPGRSAVFAPGHAWDRVVVLTPRPELMRRQLRDALTEALPSDATAADAAIDAAVHFATRVRVSGRTIAFTVPRAFFGTGEVADWSIAALVTQAKLTVEADLALPGFAGRAAAGPSLGAQAPQPGRPEDAMGYSDDRAPATAVVDLLNPDPRAQAGALAHGAMLASLGRGSGRPTAPAAAAAPATEASWFGRALLAMAHGPAGAGAATATAPATATSAAAATVAPAATPPAPAALAPTAQVPAQPSVTQRAPEPPTPAAQPAMPSAAPAAPTGTRDAAFYEEQEQRLLALKRLRDKGLISEAEYQAKRQEVLGKL